MSVPVTAGNQGPFTADEFVKIIMNGMNSRNVTPHTACQVAAAYACEAAISETFALIPKVIKRRVDEQTSETDKDHPLHRLLNIGGNEYTDAFVFHEALTLNLLRFGQAFVWVGRNNGGGIDSLTVLPSEMVTIRQLYTGEIEFQVQGKTGPSKWGDVLLIRTRSTDGITGRGPIQEAPDVFNVAIALQKHGLNVFRNGTFVGGVLTLQESRKNRTEAELREIVEPIKGMIQGPDAEGIAVLPNGAVFNTIKQSNNDAQLIQSEKEAAIRIAQLYRMPPVIIQIIEKGRNYKSNEETTRWFINGPIRSLATRYQMAIKHQLLNQPGDEDYSVCCDFDAVIDGELGAKVSAVVSQLEGGLMTIAEGREAMGRNPLDDENLDQTYISHNLVKVGENPYAKQGTEETTD